MSNNFYGPDNPGQGMPQPGQQGKLILGRGGVQSQPSIQGGAPAPQRPAPQPQAPQRQGQVYTPSPFNPQDPGPNTPYGQPGQIDNPKLPRKPRRKGRKRKIGCLATIAILVLLGIFAFSTISRVLAFGSAISTQAPLTTQTGYMSTSDRTNMLVLGYGGSGHDGSYLTDSIMVISMIPSTTHTTLVSIPRDLWVSNPPGSSTYTKINAVYEVAANNQPRSSQGADVMAQKVSTITGLDVKHWMMIDFEGFRDLINSIGGVDVYVQNSFTAQYPNNDDPNIDASWKQVSFKQGQQLMDGEQAIEYARAREVNGGDMAEGTDFARSIRQQIIVKAALSKIKSISSWPHLYAALDALQKTIYTNMSLADLGLFSTKLNLNDPHTQKIGLSTDNVMQIGTADDGKSIVQPLNGDWNQIKTYIASKLYQ